ncbi:MAG: tetratricopeptide repeat protein, partial [Planctomycetota bacterium]
MTLALLIAAVLASSGLFSPGQGAAEETPGLTRQDEKPRDSHLLFVDRVYAALNDPGNGPLDAALLEAPYRALLLVQDLLYKAALDPESPYILQAARRIAERASAVLEDSTALDAIARFDAFSSEDRARRVEIETLLLEATTAFQQNPLSLALEPCLDALDIAEALQEPFLKARACLLLGRIEENRNNREKAESLFLTALALDRLLQLTTRQVWDCCFLGDMEFKAGRHAAALAWYDQALPHASTAGDLLAEGILTANMGALLSFLGRYEEAEQALSRALTLSRDLLDRPREAYVLSAWGSLKSGMGDYAEAIRFMIEAVEAWRATGDPDREAGALLDLAGVYSEVGQTADAEDCIAGALERLPTGSGPQEKARALVTQGLCNLDEQEYEKAILFLDQAIAFLEADQGPALAEALKHRGTALLELGDAKQAEKEFTRAYEINAEKGNQYSAVLCLIGQGTALTQMHEAAQAEKVIETALHEADAMGLPELIWRASYRRGVLSESKGEDREALHHYLKAIENVEKMRRRLAAPVLLDRYLGDKLSLYRCAARLTAEQGDLESAFKLAEAGKARTLLRLSAAHPSHALHDNSLSQKLKACEAELNLLERRITESLQFSSSENEGTRADLEQRLRKARAEHKAARLRCELEAPRTTGLSGLGDPPSLEEVQQALSVDDAMLEYLAGPEGIYLFVITKDRARFVDLAVPEAHIAEWVKRILEPMDQLKQGSIDVANLFFDAKAALNLYQALIAPIRGDLGSCRHLMVLPDGCLR